MIPTPITVTLAEAEEEGLDLSVALDALTPAVRHRFARRAALAYYQITDVEEPNRLLMTASIAAFLAQTTATVIVDETGVLQVAFLMEPSSVALMGEEGQS
ncbi:MAG: hypothetical protein H0X24_16615 [Ktedonobacterales bacterium]|nr:hypothetical protein [Ktedonobacterales bacterium]